MRPTTRVLLAALIAAAAPTLTAQTVTVCANEKACILKAGPTPAPRPTQPTRGIAAPTSRPAIVTGRTGRQIMPTPTPTTRSPAVFVLDPGIFPYGWPVTTGIYYGTGLYSYPTVAPGVQQPAVEVTINNYPSVEVPPPEERAAAAATEMPAPAPTVGTVAYTVIVLPPASQADSGAFAGGRLRFVAVDMPASGDRRVFDQIVRDLCLADPYQDCRILFWSSATAVPYKLPLGPESVRTQIAEYRLNGTTGAQEFRFYRDGKPIE